MTSLRTVLAMNSRPDALNALRDATHDLLAHHEQHLFLNRPEAGRAEYLQWASAMYGWLAPFEDTLWSAPWPDSVEPTSRNHRRAWLEADLKALGETDLTIAKLPRAEFHAPLQTQAKRFGVAFVLEASTPRAQTLLKKLGSKLGVGGGSYLRGYAEQTDSHWGVFSRALTESLHNPLELEHAISAARQTFSALDDWLALRGAG